MDAVEDGVEIVVDIDVPDAQGPEALRREEGIASDVLGIFGMLPAVGFHDELGLEADEVGDVGADRYLPPKLQAGQATIAQMPPEDGLRIGEFASEFPRKDRSPIAPHRFPSIAVVNWRKR